MGEGVTHFSVIIHDRDNLLSATNISAIGDIGAHPEDLCPNAPPGESEAGSPPYLPVQGRYYTPHRHGFEYIYTGRRCSFLQTPQPHIVCLRRISSICLLNRSNQFGHHLRHCWLVSKDNEGCSRTMAHWNSELEGLDSTLRAFQLGIAGIYFHFGVVDIQHLSALCGVQGHCHRLTDRPG